MARVIRHKSYKKTEGIYQFTEFSLKINHVQGDSDSFAIPSHISIRVSHTTAKFPLESWTAANNNPIRR